MAAAGSSKTKHLGVGGVDDMTLVTVQGSGSGFRVKTVFLNFEPLNPEPLNL